MNKNYVDIHSHVLWDIDDGAKDVDETINLCYMSWDSGTSDLFVTPHLIYWNDSEDLLDERDWKCEKLSEILEDEEIDIRIHKGFEILCDDEIFEIKYFKPYTLCGSRYILIEFDFFKTSVEDVVAWCSYLITMDLVPIIAHPERYQFFHSEENIVDKLSQMGVLFQLNSGSAAGMFGSRVRAFAEKMINKGYADFMGSDAHDLMMRNTDMAYCFEGYDDVDDENLNKMLRINPFKVINNEKIEVFRSGDFAEI